MKTTPSDLDLLCYTEAVYDLPDLYDAGDNYAPSDYGDEVYDNCISYTKGYRVKRVRDIFREKPFWAVNCY